MRYNWFMVLENISIPWWDVPRMIIDKEIMMGHKVWFEKHYERYNKEDFKRFSKYEKTIYFLTVSDREKEQEKKKKLEEKQQVIIKEKIITTQICIHLQHTFYNFYKFLRRRKSKDGQFWHSKCHLLIVHLLHYNCMFTISQYGCVPDQWSRKFLNNTFVTSKPMFPLCVRGGGMTCEISYVGNIVYLYGHRLLNVLLL
jgi:hypothetical protein